MADLKDQAAWALLIAFVLSSVYELYRATAKAGTSQHDSMQGLAKNNIAFYVVAAVVIAFLFVGFEWASWVGLGFLTRVDCSLDPVLQPDDHARSGSWPH
jgi:phosphatidylserine synthase